MKPIGKLWDGSKISSVPTLKLYASVKDSKAGEVSMNWFSRPGAQRSWAMASYNGHVKTKELAYVTSFSAKLWTGPSLWIAPWFCTRHSSSKPAFTWLLENLLFGDKQVILLKNAWSHFKEQQHNNYMREDQALSRDISGKCLMADSATNDTCM